MYACLFTIPISISHSLSTPMCAVVGAMGSSTRYLLQVAGDSHTLLETPEERSLFSIWIAENANSDSAGGIDKTNPAYFNVFRYRNLLWGGDFRFIFEHGSHELPGVAPPRERQSIESDWCLVFQECFPGQWPLAHVSLGWPAPTL